MELTKEQQVLGLVVYKIENPSHRSVKSDDSIDNIYIHFEMDGKDNHFTLLHFLSVVAGTLDQFCVSFYNEENDEFEGEWVEKEEILEILVKGDFTVQSH